MADKKTGGKRWYSFFTNRTLWLVAGVATFVIVGGLLAAQIYFATLGSAKNDPNVLAVVGTKKITKTDLDNSLYGITLGSDSSSVTESQKEDVLSNLVKKEIFIQNAVRLGISVTDTEIQVRAAEIVPNYAKLIDKQKNMVLDNAKNQLIQEKVTTAVVRDYQGDYVMVRYDKYHPDMLAGTDEQTAALKASVQPVAQNIYNQIKAGTMTFDAATTLVNDDPTVALSTYPGNLGDEGGQFTATSSISQGTNFLETVRDMKKDELKLFSVKMNTISADAKPAQLDGSFVVVRLTTIKTGEADTIEQWLQDQANKSKVEVYNEKVN
jgi:hypothetical protein